MNDSKGPDLASALISKMNKAITVFKSFHNLHINEGIRFHYEKYY